MKALNQIFTIKNRKVSNLVMKNIPNTTKLQRTNILYKYECM